MLGGRWGCHRKCIDRCGDGDEQTIEYVNLDGGMRWLDKIQSIEQNSKPVEPYRFRFY